MRSGRCTDSTFTTSAPRQARTWEADGPAHQAVQSSTRTPASGRFHSLSGAARARDGQSTVPAADPSEGAGAKCVGDVPEIRYGTRGWRKRPDGDGAKTSRATNCSKEGMV